MVADVTISPTKRLHTPDDADPMCRARASRPPNRTDEPIGGLFHQQRRRDVVDGAPTATGGAVTLAMRS